MLLKVTIFVSYVLTSPLPPRLITHAHQRREHELNELPCPRLDLDRGDHAGGEADVSTIDIHRVVLKAYACRVDEARCGVV